MIKFAGLLLDWDFDYAKKHSAKLQELGYYTKVFGIFGTSLRSVSESDQSCIIAYSENPFKTEKAQLIFSEDILKSDDSLNANHSIHDFMESAAAKKPTPGGGSVAALTGALSACMGEMVLAYSVDKKDLQEHSQINREFLMDLNNCRRKFYQYMREDQVYYSKLNKSKKNQVSESEIDLLQEKCVFIPRDIIKNALDVLRICLKIKDISNKYLKSDLLICGELALATIRCGIYNIDINLPYLKNEILKNDLAEFVKIAKQEGVSIIQKLV
jgi:formiminotetrahydrofolate cyclodeaminase